MKASYIDETMAAINQDARPRKGGWAPGNYSCRCYWCDKVFMGDKRAISCAPCAYGGAGKDKVRPERVSQVIGDYLARMGAPVIDADWSNGSDVIRRKVGEVLNLMPVAAEDNFHRLVPKCESPIEAIGLAAVLAHFPHADAVESLDELREIDDWEIAVIPQLPFKGYRLDIAVIERGSKTVFALECDGKQYHFDTRKDVDRNLALWANNCIAFHLSGSVLCRNPYEAVEPLAKQVREYGRAAVVQALRG